jgi:large exoprotein involved in heme utilization and adhesion
VTAKDSVKLIGFKPPGTLTTQTRGSGNAGDITINTKKLIVSDGAEISTNTYGNGSAGQLTVNASDSVELSGTSPDGINSGLFSFTSAAGDAGNIILNTGRLTLEPGAAISAESTARFEDLIPATGRGGNLNLNATDSVQLKGSFINTSTVGSGDAGNIMLKTGRLILQNGGEVSTATYGKGKGGTIDVNASNSVELVGISPDDNSPSRLFTSTDSSTYSSLFPSTEGTGDAGNLTLATKQLTVRDGAEVSVSSVGSTSGNAGNLEANTNSIRLDNAGKFIATSESGKGGGNITLKNQDLLLLRGSSEISTDARRGAGKGGDITINTDILTATENSNITARAVQGQGGNIRIATQGLFVSPNSQINADSQQGINGIVEINRPDIDPSAELVVLPANIVDVSGLVASSCGAGGNLGRVGSEFVISGRGGLPPNPAEAIRSDTALVDLGKPVQGGKNGISTNIPSNLTIAQSALPLVEASGWMIGSSGEVILIAAAPTTAATDIPWLTSTSCHGS